MCSGSSGWKRFRFASSVESWGAALALLGSHAVETFMRDRLPFSPTETLIRPEASLLAVCLAAALALGSLAGLLPAWRASRLAPIEAIRAGGGL